MYFIWNNITSIQMAEKLYLFPITANKNILSLKINHHTTPYPLAMKHSQQTKQSTGKGCLVAFWLPLGGFLPFPLMQSVVLPLFSMLLQ